MPAKLFRVWLSIGIQSFGGGTTTLALIRRNIVDLHGWITEEQFNHDWALCQVTPGINLIGLTILIGRQIGGALGIATCLIGLLLPSALLTAALTAGFLAIRDVPSVKGALSGVLPATIGLGFVTACMMAHQPLLVSIKRGRWDFGFAVFLLAGSAALLWSGRVSITVVLILAGVIGALESLLRDRFFRPRRVDPS